MGEERVRSQHHLKSGRETTFDRKELVEKDDGKLVNFYRLVNGGGWVHDDAGGIFEVDPLIHGGIYKDMNINLKPENKEEDEDEEEGEHAKFYKAELDWRRQSEKELLT